MAQDPAPHQYPCGRYGRRLRLQRQRFLPALSRGDGRHLRDGGARGTRQHGGDRRAVQRGHEAQDGALHAAEPRTSGGDDAGLPPRGGGKGGAQDASERGHTARRVCGTPGVRAERHHPDGLLRLLPDRGRDHSGGKRAGDPHWPRARLSGGVPRGLEPAHHGAGPPEV